MIQNSFCDLPKYLTILDPSSHPIGLEGEQWTFNVTTDTRFWYWIFIWYQVSIATHYIKRNRTDQVYNGTHFDF